MTIINFMPAYAEAPVSLHLLKANVEAGLAKISELAAAGEVAVVLPANETELLAKVAETGAKACPTDGSFGFVYSNATALERVVAGEKPVPQGTSERAEATVVSGEALLSGDDATKLVWAAGAEAPVSVPAHTTGEALLAALGVEASEAKAVYLGFPQGAFVDAAHLADELDVASDYVRVYTQKNCMANALFEICDRYRKETCGHCVFGHEGSYQLDVIASDICHKKGRPAQVDLVRDLTPVMAEQSLCEVGQTMARTVAAAFDLFGDEIEQHFTKKVCPAGECQAYMTYHILPTKCIGCGECVDACEEEAILGKPRFIHVIDQKACTKCGACLSACEEGAIIMAGADKPRTPPRPIPIRKR
ncbi:NADH-ubiquinone oxidoreductase-F iron-sulfur binding region domain-containing protein [Olsenella profusa]|uniref:4Fe-4S binding protein n=1 Tax=Olsenella profusa TaxID=138595 RepID=A0ABS2F3C8_9ACTN|nr:NADH-ubiquinone oxidoreductase-F iron-sulfur binding region domain-containing protein [Olsenella profusa]MBM6775501.1 4Fe-4S binding protein [Olsenella profusa]